MTFVGPNPTHKIPALESLRGVLAVCVLSADVGGRALMDSENLLLAQRIGALTPITGLAGRLLEMPWLQSSGKVSFSIYLVHIPVLYLVFHGLIHTAPDLRNWQFLAAALPATLGVSALTWRWIEVPAMRWGNHGPLSVNRRRGLIQ